MPEIFIILTAFRIGRLGRPSKLWSSFLQFFAKHCDYSTVVILAELSYVSKKQLHNKCSLSCMKTRRFKEVKLIRYKRTPTV